MAICDVGRRECHLGRYTNRQADEFLQSATNSNLRSGVGMCETRSVCFDVCADLVNPGWYENL